MKLMIASDLHGSAYYCRKLLEAYEREQPEKLVLLGDLLYHGPRNDLPRDYAPKEVLSLLNAQREHLLCVRGNCDTEVDQMVLSFPILADYSLLYVAGHTLFATHGHHYHTGALPPLQRGDILLHGHTHIPAWETFGEENRYWNPGSVSIPKEGSPHSYLVLEEETARWMDLEGSVFHQEPW
jgi:hypothetical protein